MGQIGDAGAVAELIKSLYPDREPDPMNRGAAATALGLIGLGRTSGEEVLVKIQSALAGVNDLDSHVNHSARLALARINHMHKPQAGRIDTLPLFETAYRNFLARSSQVRMRPFVEDLTEAINILGSNLGRPPKTSAPKEADYQRFLMGVLQGKGYSVVEEARPAAGQRTDLLLHQNDFHGCIELKILGNGDLDQNLGQLKQYLNSLNRNDSLYQGFLLRLDQNLSPRSGKELKQQDIDGITIWDLHVNRAIASG